MIEINGIGQSMNANVSSACTYGQEVLQSRCGCKPVVSANGGREKHN